jgi:hypothetical protein
VPFVIEPPSKGPRLWTRSWEAGRWRGSSGDLIAAADAAREEIVTLGLEIGMIESVEVGYADESDQAFGSLAAWSGDPSLGAPGEIRSVRVVLDGDTAKVKMEGGPKKGLVVVAEGSETFANGIRATMKSRLSGGADAAAEAVKAVPVSRSQRIAVVVALVVSVALGVGFYYYESPEVRWATPGILVGVLLFSALLIPIYGFGSEEREKRFPPRFVLVPEGEQFADEPEEDDGPIWKAKRWLDRHPFLKWAGTLALGALAGALAGHALYH